MLVITATSGGAIAVRVRISPGALMPISRTAASVGGSMPRTSQGQAEVIVEVALGLEDPEFRREKGGGEFLGRRLADASGDADDADRRSARTARASAWRAATVSGTRTRAKSGPAAAIGAGDDGPGRAARGRVGDEIVAVAAGDDGEEKLARRRPAGIDAETAEGAVRISLEDRSARRSGRSRPSCSSAMLSPSPVSRRISRTTSPSLNGIVRSFRT